MNAKRRRFVIEYCVDNNATKAAIRAGYSEKSAHVQGSKLLENPEVQGAVDDRLEELARAAAITVETVLVGLLTEARYHGKGASHSARVTAWQTLGKYFKMFTDKIEHDIGPSDFATLAIEATKAMQASVDSDTD